MVSFLSSGTIFVVFADEGGKTTIKMYDQNLNEFNELKCDAVTSFCVFEWTDECEYLFVAEKSTKVSIYIVHDLKNVWKETTLNMEITASVYRKAYDQIVMGTKCGKIISTTLHSI